MLISDRIAAMILAMLREHGGTLELQRNDIAERIGCSPSQINYVIRSRFSPELGYRVESRRGGGGYVRIVQCTAIGKRERLSAVLRELPPRLQLGEAEAIVSRLLSNELLSEESAAVMRAAFVSDDPFTVSAQLRRMLAAVLST
jgi:transcriptional regulator CtsR